MSSLMKEPCGERCSSNADFKITFIINSMTLIDEEYYKDVEKILSITWDHFVHRSTFPDSLDGEREEIQIHCTPQQLSEKLKSCPIMMNICTGEGDEIGTVKFPISDCFCDAVLCEKFNLERLENVFTFVQGGEEIAFMDIDLIVQKCDAADGENALEAVDKLTKELQESKKLGKTPSPVSSELLYSEFACPDELTDECKKNLALGEYFYRIINGHLVNEKDKRGFCGEICDTTKKYCEELKEMPSEKTSSVDILKFFNEKIDIDSEMEFKKDFEIEKKRSEIELMKKESLSRICKILKKRFEKSREIEVENVEKKQPKKVKKIKNKKTKKIVTKSAVVKPKEHELRKLIEESKKAAKGKYSYEFGNTHPFHRYGCNIPKPIEKVPSNMGWRHDKLQFRNKTWQPGQIDKTVRILMKHHLTTYPCDTLALSNTKRKMKIDGSSGDELKSTLHVTKRNGELSIQMCPLKEGKDLETDCNAYLNCKPLEFIIKKQPEEIKQHKARMILKSRGFERKCKCIDIEHCRCISQAKKLLFRDELKIVSQVLGLKKEMQYDDVYESSESEMSFDHTVPTVSAAKSKPPNIIHTGTQYDVKHFPMKKDDLKTMSKIKSLK